MSEELLYMNRQTKSFTHTPISYIVNINTYKNIMHKDIRTCRGNMFLYHFFIKNRYTEIFQYIYYKGFYSTIWNQRPSPVNVGSSAETFASNTLSNLAAYAADITPF